MVFDYFSCIGISYKKSNTQTRSKFGLTPDEIQEIYRNTNLKHILIVSTCNRTEIYSFDNDEDALIQLLQKDSPIEFREQMYSLRGRKGFEHFIRVYSGMDSQLVGDYEISSQIKKFIQFSHEEGKMGGHFHKMINFGQSIGKGIRTKSGLNDKQLSLSKLVYHFLFKKVDKIHQKKVLLIGMGGINQSILELILPLQPRITNRTNETSLKLSKKWGVPHLPFQNLEEGIRDSDIIILSTNSKEYLINDVVGEKIIIDLSIPQGVNPRLRERDTIRLIDVDELSNEVLLQSKIQLDTAESILQKRLDKYEAQLREGIEFIKKYLS